MWVGRGARFCGSAPVALDSRALILEWPPHAPTSLGEEHSSAQLMWPRDPTVIVPFGPVVGPVAPLSHRCRLRGPLDSYSPQESVEPEGSALER